MIGYLKLWRGIIICIICLIYFTFGVDYNKEHSFWEKFIYVIIILVSWGGMILFYVDFWKSEKEGIKRNIWLFPKKDESNAKQENQKHVNQK